MSTNCLRLRIANVAAAWILSVIAGTATTLAQPGRAGDKPSAVSRLDLANAYQRVDAQFMQRIADRNAEPPEGIDRESDAWRAWTLLDEPALADLNTRADRAAVAFFGGNIGGVAAQMNALLAQRPGDNSDEHFRSLAHSLHLDVNPARPTVDAMSRGGTYDGDCTFSVSSIYPLPEGIELPKQVGLMIVFNETGSSESSLNQLILEMDASRRVSGSVRVHLDGPLRAGTREIMLRSGGMGFDQPGGMGFDLPDQPRRTHVKIGQWTILPESIPAVRERLGRRLETIAQREATEPQRLAQDLLRRRLGLLDLADSPTRSIALLTDYAQLIGELDRECTMVEAGIDPYADRSGDTWYGVRLVEEVYFPARVYVPRAVNRQAPMPLVIALHGAGGDENLFMDAYGDGIIKELADEHGFAVVSPEASPLMDLGVAFDAIVSLMKALYDIDENRIYVIGHSMGAMMTGSMSASRTDRIAAACWLAGASYGKGASIPPTLAIGAELDGLIAPARVKAVVDVAQEAGMDVEYREVADLGHVLMVGYVLPEVIDWLLPHTLK